MGIIDLIFPKFCLNCKTSGKYICNKCLSEVEVINELNPTTETIAVFKYQGVIRKGIIKIKYNFAYDVAKELADSVIKNTNLNSKKAVLIPIPLHKSRQNWRGFNQSEIVGKLVAEKLNWNFEKDLLVRNIKGKNQVGLLKSDRVRNMSGKFAVNNSLKNQIKPDFTYILFDDVATTGSTIKEGIKVLKNEGANNIFGLTIAR